MKFSRLTLGAVLSSMSLVVLLQLYSTVAKAESMPGFYGPYEMPTPQYNYGTAWLVALGGVTGAVLASGIGNDKKGHFILSMPLGAASEYLLRQLNIASDDRWRRIGIATAMGLMPGLAKELTDSSFDGGDLAADLAGSFMGALAADLYQGPVQPMLAFDWRDQSIMLAVRHRF